MIRFPKRSAFVLAIALSACSSQSGSLLPANDPLAGDLHTTRTVARSSSELVGSFIIRFRNGKVVTTPAVTMARKVDAAGEWLSMRGKGFDWQYRTTLIDSVSVYAPDGSAHVMALANVPIHAQHFSMTPHYLPCSYSGRRDLAGAGCCVDSCGSDGTAWGECGSGSCGSPGPDITGGVGTGTNYPGGGDMGCNLNFSDGTLDCFDGSGTNNLNAPADLFLQFRLTITDAYLTCANPVNAGYADATYADPNQRGGATKVISVGPGTNTWDFPSDFGPFHAGYVYPPSQPLKMAATYYKWGLVGRWGSVAQGYCKYPHA